MDLTNPQVTLRQARIEELEAELAKEREKSTRLERAYQDECVFRDEADRQLAKEREKVRELKGVCTTYQTLWFGAKDELAAAQEKVKALEATWIGYNKLQEELAAAQATIAEAADEIESWGSYASEYFQKKHDLAGVVARFRSADQDALHEDRARAVELLKSDLQWREKEFGLDDLNLYQWLDEEAAAHRARKEGK